MSLEPYFTQYPNLKAAFWPDADIIKWATPSSPGYLEEATKAIRKLNLE